MFLFYVVLCFACLWFLLALWALGYMINEEVRHDLPITLGELLLMVVLCLCLPFTLLIIMMSVKDIINHYKPLKVIKQFIVDLLDKRVL